MAELNADFGRGIEMLIRRELAPLREKIKELEQRIAKLEKRRFGFFGKREEGK